MSNTDMDWLTDLLGGPENFPPQLPPPPPPPPPDPFDGPPPPIVRDPNYVLPSIRLRQAPTINVAPAAPDGEDFTIDKRKGEFSPLGMCFTPFVALTKYCYKFVDRGWNQPIASAFFDKGKIFRRSWDL